MARIIFMGTPEFAVPSLQALISKGHKVALVVTQPDRPAHRGKKLSPPPIKILAEQFQIPVLQPESLRKEKEALDQILSIQADFLVVAAFGQILPKTLLDHPQVAPLNVHSSLLPEYRGAAPIQRAIMEGNKTTGVTIQWMVEELDMGDILVQIPCEIQESDTSATLHDRLKDMGAQALIQCLESFEKDCLQRIAQDPRIGSYARKIQKSEAMIDFQQSGFQVHRLIMGLNPWPVAECRYAGERLRVFRSSFVPRDPQADPGTIVDLQDDGLIVATGEGCVALHELQLENRKRLSFNEFRKGFPLHTGQILGGR